MTGPSVHLSWDELACHDAARTPYPAEWRLTRAVQLAEAFEAIRAIWGVPITVTSGYRTPAYNASVGGAPHSQHVQGLALDLEPPDGVTVQDFWDEILRMAEDAGIRGVGYAAPSKGHFVHIDCRDADTVEHWTY